MSATSRSRSSSTPKSATAFACVTDDPLPRPDGHRIASKEAVTALRARIVLAVARPAPQAAPPSVCLDRMRRSRVIRCERNARSPGELKSAG
jgi:hypothetical protein